jgi:hypothetical protein
MTGLLRSSGYSAALSPAERAYCSGIGPLISPSVA